MSRSKPLCERCGEPALVHVTNEAPDGATVRHMCLRCADIEESAEGGPNSFLNYGAILISVGLVALVISVFADELKFGDSNGFGPKQQISMAAGAILIFTAALVRAPTLLVIGILAGSLTILADLLQFGHDPGFGWHQILGMLVGITLILSGWLESRRQT